MSADAPYKPKHLKLKKWGQVLLASSFFSAFFFAPLPYGTAASEGSAGIVSIDFCAYQYLLALAGKNRIQAVSFEAAGPRSFYGQRATGLPTVTGSVAELIQMQPNLVVRTWRGGPRAVKILERVGVQTYTPPYAMTIRQSIDVLGETAVAIGEAEAGKTLVANYKKRWDKLEAAPRSTLKAAYLTPSGITAGTGTYVNEIFKLAGFNTLADEAGISGWVPLPLEKLALGPPDFIVTSFFGDRDVHVSHWSSGRHGIYKKLLGDLPVISVPSRYLSCSGAFAVDAAELIRSKAEKMGLFDTVPKPVGSDAE